jgi:hypothetical protein
MVLMILIICLRNYENQKIIRSRDFIFNEKVMYKDQLRGKKYEKEKPKYIVDATPLSSAGSARPLGLRIVLSFGSAEPKWFFWPSLRPREPNP